MVASSQPLASQAGLSVLMEGGNAADAAVAAAAALNVTEPCSTGLGGDCFALHYDAKTRAVTALNGSGRAPAALTIALLRSQGMEKDGRLRDPYHAHAVTVPGACAAWCDLASRHGSLPMGRILAPAIRMAEEGFPVAPLTAHHWAAGAERQLARTPGGSALTVNGRGPLPGELFRNPGLGRALRAVAEGGAEAFYRGVVGRDIAAAVRRAGGVMEASDLEAHASTWEEPIRVEYRGHGIWECPPNGQGLAALAALSVLRGFDVGALPPEGAERLHLLIEAVRLGFADALRHVADPAFSPAPLEGLLSEPYARSRRALFDPARALREVPASPIPAGADTVYLCAVDGAGNACSLINSNYMGFGTGIVPEGRDGPWGFSLQNRGHNFSLDPSHPNALAPGKRPYHTIIPGMITRPDGSLWGPFGVMGGFMQPQGHVQVAVALLDDGEDPQEALDRPRFCVEPSLPDSVVRLEEGIGAEAAAGLSSRGHAVSFVSGHGRSLFGRGQVIRREADGVLWAGSDPRADGCAMGF